VSPAPADLGLATADTKNGGFFVHMEEQLDLVPAVASKAIFDVEVPAGTFETDATPVNNGLLQALIAVVLRLDGHLSGTLFQAKQPRIRLGTPQETSCHLGLVAAVHACSVVCRRAAEESAPLRMRMVGVGARVDQEILVTDG
jgi:hypothetical protein